ncbi:uncharacterized protein LOC144876312 [Branchiostoma floridae x Branchiostoma japonicum]
MESVEKLFTSYLLLLIWLHVSAQPSCGPDEMLKGGECQPCPVCPDGQQLSTVCGHGDGAGAECISCPPDYFSNTDSKHRCIACANCTDLNAEYRQPCSPGTAAVCGTCLPGHYEEFHHCHSCTKVPSDNQYCRQWLADHQTTQKTTPQPGSVHSADGMKRSVVITVACSSVFGVIGIVALVLVAGVFISKKWTCTTCKSTKRKNQAPKSSAPEEDTLLPMECPALRAIPDQSTVYTDDPSMTRNSANGHIASVSYDNEQNNWIANQTMTNGNIVSGHMANGNFPPVHMANGNLPSVHMANGNIPSAHMANGNIPPVHMANGNLPPVHMANGNLPPVHMANGNLPPVHMANGNLPSAHMANDNSPSAPVANGAVATEQKNLPISTRPGVPPTGDTPPDAPPEAAEMVVTENLQRAEPYTSLPHLARSLQDQEGAAATNTSPPTPVSSSAMVTAMPDNSQCSSSPAPVDHSIPSFPTIPAQMPAGNDPMTNALPYGIQNYHSAETLPTRGQETPGRPACDGSPLFPSSAQNVTSRSLLQGEAPSALPDDAIHPSPGLARAICNSSDMEDIYDGSSSATDVSSLGAQDVSPKSLLREQSAGPLTEADGAPSMDSDQSSEVDPSRDERCAPDGRCFLSAVGGDHPDGERELSLDQSSEGSGEEPDPIRTQREDDRHREAVPPAVEVPESQASYRQTVNSNSQELMDKAFRLQTGVKVAELDPDTREELALLLDPDPPSPGVHKTWRHFAREFKIREELIRNWHGLCDVLLYLETNVNTVPEVLQALFQINRFDALEKLCNIIIEQSEGNTSSGQ